MTQFDQFLEYKDAKHGAEFQRLSPNTKLVAFVASFLSKTLFNETLMVTSIYRKKTSDSGIHEGYRAIDFKPLKDISNTYRLIEMLNQIFTYDPLRTQIKVAHPNPYHGTAPHIHLQSHDSTCVLTKPRLMEFLAQASKDQSSFKPEVI